MIQTMMALWNRGTSGRLLVMVVTFFSLCISISLLFVTVGSIWGSLLAHGRQSGGDPQRPVSNAVLITATAPPSVTPTPTIAPIGVTPTLPPNPCLASPTGAHRNTARVDATGNNGRRNVPSTTATSRPLHRTPTPGATMLPTPSPTLPAVTPSVPGTPAATTTPGSTSTVTVTPTGTSTPGASPTPTVTLTPAGTSTPSATPTATGTSTNTPTATATGTATPVTTAVVTVTMPAGSPTVVGRQTHDGRPQIPPGTPGDGNNDQPGQANCLGDALVTSGETSLLSRLQDFMWVILLSSLLGTILFCGQMYRLSGKARG